MSKRTETRRRWERIVGRYERAGRSQATFASEHKVGLAALRYWIYKLRGTRPGPIRPAPEVRLLPVEVPVAGAGATVEVRLGEVSIVLPAGTSATYVAEIAAALRASAC